MNASHEKFGGSPWGATFAITDAQTLTVKLCPPPGSRTPAGAALHAGVAEGGSNTTCQDTALTQAQTDFWRNKLIKFTSGANNGHVRLVTAFNAGTDTLTFTPSVGTPVANLDTFELYTSESANRLVLTSVSITGFNTAALAPIILRNHASTTAVWRATIPPTTGTISIADNNIWRPLIADESLQYNCNTHTGTISLNLEGRIISSNMPLIDKLTYDA